MQKEWRSNECSVNHEYIKETVNRSLQANRYNKGNSNFEHFWRENPFDIIHKSHHMDNNENLQVKISSKKS